MRTPPSTSVARSCMTTVSAPRRHDAAGEDAHALARPDRACSGLPANDSPTRFNVVSSPDFKSAKRTAHPSIAELSWPGTAMRRHDVLGQHAVEREPHVHALGSGHRRQELADQRARLVDGHRVRDRSRRRTRLRAGSWVWSWRFRVPVKRDFRRERRPLERMPGDGGDGRAPAAATARRGRRARARASAASASAARETNRRRGHTNSRPMRLNGGHTQPRMIGGDQHHVREERRKQRAARPARRDSTRRAAPRLPHRPATPERASRHTYASEPSANSSASSRTTPSFGASGNQSGRTANSAASAHRRRATQTRRAEQARRCRRRATRRTGATRSAASTASR